MKKSLIVAVSVLLVLLVLGAWLEPTGVVLGWMNGETFYRDRPTRYWRRALTSSDPAVQARTHHELKEGGRSAVPVLADVLRTSENPEARWKAADLLARIFHGFLQVRACAVVQLVVEVEVTTTFPPVTRGPPP